MTAGLRSPLESGLQRHFSWLLVVGIILNALGLFTPILETDGTLYAAIAKNMAQTNDFIDLTLEGDDWLDKPHFPFWITAISYKIFGYTSFAYKLPPFLFWLAGAYYTYQLARLLYSTTVAQLAVLFYLTAEHLLISNVDVRAEPYLTGMGIASVYFFYRAYRNNDLWNILWGSLWTAAAIMTKGLFVIIIIGAGFVIEWVVKGDWKQFISPKWYVAIFLTALFSVPELYTLYVQFDLHPEKVVFGKTGVSGLYFFFWESQFGRFMNTGPIKGSGDPLFYTHTLLWAFLPWSALLYVAIFTRLLNKNGWKDREYVVVGTSVFSFIIFSASKFQLPHYLNILFPFFSILTAFYLAQITHESTTKRVIYFQYFVAIILFLSTLLGIYLININHALIVGIIVAVVAGGLLYLFPAKSITNVIVLCFMASVLMNSIYSAVLYPDIIRYQSGNTAAAYINEHPEIKGVTVIRNNPINFALEFYANVPHTATLLEELPSIPAETPLFIETPYLAQLRERGYEVTVLKRFPHYHISKLTMKFINTKTRPAELQETALVAVTKK